MLVNSIGSYWNCFNAFSYPERYDFIESIIPHFTGFIEPLP